MTFIKCVFSNLKSSPILFLVTSYLLQARPDQESLYDRKVRLSSKSRNSQFKRGDVVGVLENGDFLKQILGSDSSSNRFSTVEVPVF